MNLKLFFFSVLVLAEVASVEAQTNMGDSNRRPRSFDLGLAFSGDTLSFIRIMDNYKIEQLMDSLASSRNSVTCMNGLAVEVMRSRLGLLKEVSCKYYARNTMDNIRCMLHNLYHLTAIRPEGDHDFFGTTFISLHSISQYEEWLKSNGDQLCIDPSTRVLFVPRE